MLAAKRYFIGPEGITHLATGGEPPLLKAQRDAFEAYANDKARGYPGYHVRKIRSGIVPPVVAAIL